MRYLICMLAMACLGCQASETQAADAGHDAGEDASFPDASDGSEEYSRADPFWYEQSKGWRTIHEFSELGGRCRIEILEDLSVVPVEQFRSFGAYDRMNPRPEGLEAFTESLGATLVDSTAVPVLLGEKRFEHYSTQSFHRLFTAVRLDTGRTVLALRLSGLGEDGAIESPRRSVAGVGVDCYDKWDVSGIIDYSTGAIRWSRPRKWTMKYALLGGLFRADPPEGIMVGDVLLRHPFDALDAEVVTIEPRWVMDVVVDGSQIIWARYPDDESVNDVSELWAMDGVGPKFMRGAAHGITCGMAAFRGVTMGFSGIRDVDAFFVRYDVMDFSRCDLKDSHFWVLDAADVVRESPALSASPVGPIMIATDGVYGAALLDFSGGYFLEEKVLVFRLSDWVAREIPVTPGLSIYKSEIAIVGGDVYISLGSFSGYMTEVQRYSLDDFENLGVPFSWAE